MQWCYFARILVSLHKLKSLLKRECHEGKNLSKMLMSEYLMSLQNGYGAPLYCHFERGRVMTWDFRGPVIRTSGAFQLEIEGENPNPFCRGESGAAMSGDFPFLILFYFSNKDVFIFYCCCTKLPQAQGLESTPIYDHAGLWVKVQDVPGRRLRVP